MILLAKVDNLLLISSSYTHLQPQRSTPLYGINGFGELLVSWWRLNHSNSNSSKGQGFVLVYLIASRSTFDRLEVFRQSMLRVKRKTPVFMLVGNKCDQISTREVSKDEGKLLAGSFGCSFMETLAKTAYNVELLFTNLVRALQNAQQGDAPIPAPQRPLEDRTQQRKKRCFIL